MVLLGFSLGMFHQPAIYAGDLTGSVTIFGPVSKKVQMISPYARQRYAKSPVTTTQGGETGNVVVYIENPPAGDFAVPDDTLLMDQKNLTFTPHVLPIMTGATVGFLNSDDVFHNIFSLSQTKKFNLGRYPAGELQTVTFDKPGRIDVFCDIHVAMSAVILVFEHPHFTKVDSTGDYILPGIPAGTYQVHFWHEDLDDIRKQVTIPENGQVTLNAELRK